MQLIDGILESSDLVLVGHVVAIMPGTPILTDEHFATLWQTAPENPEAALRAEDESAN